ncbi:hypothetical protein HK098_003214 [Nowakowskiella sp. JEL0407]|nr:hypothetical protein HK098_003214 [Nowakowskiella sp. JEL0407]
MEKLEGEPAGISASSIADSDFIYEREAISTSTVKVSGDKFHKDNSEVALENALGKRLFNRIFKNTSDPYSNVPVSLLSVSPCSEYLAVLANDTLNIQSLHPTKRSSPLSIKLKFQPPSSPKILTWSSDSLVVVIYYTDDLLQCFRVDGVQINSYYLFRQIQSTFVGNFPTESPPTVVSILNLKDPLTSNYRFIVIFNDGSHCHVKINPKEPSKSQFSTIDKSFDEVYETVTCACLSRDDLIIIGGNSTVLTKDTLFTVWNAHEDKFNLIHPNPLPTNLHETTSKLATKSYASAISVENVSGQILIVTNDNCIYIYDRTFNIKKSVKFKEIVTFFSEGFENRSVSAKWFDTDTLILLLSEQVISLVSVDPFRALEKWNSNGRIRDYDCISKSGFVYLDVHSTVVFNPIPDARSAPPFIAQVLDRIFGSLPQPIEKTVIISSTKLLKSTPIESLHRKLTLHDYQAAIRIANDYNLDKDLVYKARWINVTGGRNPKITQSEIADILDHVSDIKWVLNVCSYQILPSLNSMHNLLKYAVSKTNVVNLKMVEDAWNAIDDELEQIVSSPRPSNATIESTSEKKTVKEPEIKLEDWIHYRLKFLEYLDRLESHRSMYPKLTPHYSISTSTDLNFLSVSPLPKLEPSLKFPSHYRWFRDTPLLEIAKHFAETSQLKNLSVLFLRHETVHRNISSIIDYIPVSMDVELHSQLKKLLPVVNEKEILLPWRKPDWCESQLVTEYVAMMSDTIFEATTVDTPVDEAEARDWYVHRALEAEKFGFVAEALSLLNFAQEEAKIPGLNALIAKLSILTHLPANVTSESFDELSTKDVVELCLRDVNECNVGELITQVVVPYLERCHEDLQILEDWMVEVAKHNISLCVALLREWNGFKYDGLRVVVNCAYAYEDDEDFELVVEMYQLYKDRTAVKSRKSSNEESTEEGWEDGVDLDLEELDAEREDWENFAKCLETHFAAREILLHYGLVKSLNWFMEIDQKQLKADLEQNTTDFQLLITHLRQLVSLGIFTEFSTQELITGAVRQMLECARFSEAQSVLFPENSLPLLPIHHVESLIIDLATEFLDNAEESDMTKGLLKNAFEWHYFASLRVIPASPQTTKLMNLIHAIHTLSRNDVLFDDSTSLPLVPIQIRHYSDRLKLLERLVAAKPETYYNKLSAVLDLAEKLGSTDELAKIRCRIAVIDAALSENHASEVMTGCFEIIRLAEQHFRDNENGIQDLVWRLCVRVASRALIDNEVRKRLAAYAMNWCPVSHIDSVLDLWREIDVIQETTICESIAMSASGMGSGLIDRINAIAGTGSKSQQPNSIRSEPTGVEEALETLDRIELEVDERRTTENDFTGQKVFTRANPTKIIKNSAIALLETRNARSSFLGVSYKSSIISLGYSKNEFVTRVVKYCNGKIALAGLISCDEDEYVIEFFEEMSENLRKRHEHLACYIFSTRALYDISSVTNTVPPVTSMSIDDMIELALRIPVTDKHGKNSDRFIKSIGFAKERFHNEAERTVDAYLEQEMVDKSLWESSAEYRSEVVSNLAKSTDKLDRAILLAESVELISQVVTSHLEFLFTSQLDLKKIRDSLSQVKSLNLVSADVLDELASLNQIIDGRDHERLLLYYNTIVDFIGSDVLDADVESLKKRISLLETFTKHPLFTSLDIRDLISRNQSNDEGTLEESYLEIWHNLEDYSQSGVKTFTEQLPNMLHLQGISFLGEKYMSVTSIDLSNIVRRITSAVYMGLVIRIFNEIEWEVLESESIDELLEEISTLCAHLEPMDLVQVGSLFTVGNKGVKLPVESRKIFLALIEVYLSDKDVQVAKAELHAITDHLNLMNRLQFIADPNSDSKVPEFWLHEFDLAFGCDVEELTSLCIQMVVKGISPLIVYEVSKILVSTITSLKSPSDSPRTSTSSLQAASPGSLRRLDIRSIYVNALKSVLVETHSTEETLASIDCILTSVVQYLYFDLNEDEWGSDEANVGGGTDGKRDEVTKMLGEVEAILKKCLMDVVQQIGPVEISSDVRMGALKLFQKHFPSALEELEQLRAYRLAAKVLALWELEIDGSLVQRDVDEQIYLIEQLLATTETSEQALELRSMLLEWDPKLDSSDLKQCWGDFLVWMARNEQFGLLLATRILITERCTLSLGMESQLLDALEEVNVVEKWKHALLSQHEETRNSSALAIIESVKSNKLESCDWILHLLLSSNGFAESISNTRLWTSFCRSLQADYSQVQMHESYNIPVISFEQDSNSKEVPKLQRLLIRKTIADLTASGKYTHAAGLLYSFSGVHSELSSGIANRMGMLRNFLSFDSGDSGANERDGQNSDYVGTLTLETLLRAILKIGQEDQKSVRAALDSLAH